MARPPPRHWAAIQRFRSMVNRPILSSDSQNWIGNESVIAYVMRSMGSAHCIAF